MIFALAGNQNCGKTTLFNQLTGSNQHVGNFPGVTVDQKVGQLRGEKGVEVADLPGIYSIRPYTAEEIVTRDFILNQKPDGIINIVDATNLERNLYLTLQLLAMRVPMVVALNMMDEVRGNGGAVNCARLSELLGVPVVPISAAKNEGIEELVTQALRVARERVYPAVTDFCAPGPVHRCIHAVCHVIEDHAQKLGVSARFAATKLIEGDDDMAARLGINQNERELIEHSVQEMESERKLDRNAALADMRYAYIENACRQSVVKARESREHLRSVRIDSVLTNKYLAIPIFLGIMLLVFYLTFGLIGQALSDLLSQGIDALAVLAGRGLTAYGINPVIHSLIIDGVFTGVGSVLSFLPLIVVLFFFLSILEDTGYMARVAFVMDKLLRKLGLSGRSIVPLLIGFGCTVPAIMAARTLSSERDRRMTILLTPFMSCSAKIPIYAVFVAAFFPRHPALVMIGLYAGGMVVGVLAALVYNKTVFRGNSIPFVMELPNYRFPSARSVGLLLWEKARDFIQRAFTVIFVATLVIWFLQTFDAKLNVVSDGSLSLLAGIGRFLSPVLAPLGFGDWRAASSLIAGFTAKEAVVSTLSVLTGATLSTLAGSLGALFTAKSALSFLVFTLLYTPCVAAVGTVRQEMGRRRDALFFVVIQCLIAWVAALLFYRLLLLF
ncbi:MAG: ferrous iron transport protein B [Oscillospiraceae bacterium]|nr:ferrous iron transport protein B [Oscillospiraceae bacterium]